MVIMFVFETTPNLPNFSLCKQIINNKFNLKYIIHLIILDQNIATKEAEKHLKYKRLKIEISRMWGVIAHVVTIVILSFEFCSAK